MSGWGVTAKAYSDMITLTLRSQLLLYGDSMILAECIFSQFATGEVSSAYFRKLAISGWGVQIFARNGPNARLSMCRNTLTVSRHMRPASTLVKRRKRRRNPNLTAVATKYKSLCET